MALLLVPSLLVHSGDAQSTGDPWFGLTDRERPTSGFAIRVPVIVENQFDYVLQDPFVAAEIDFGKLLVEAGWTNQTVGTEARPRGFTLDLDSIRVIEYSNGFVTGPRAGQDTIPTPHVFYPALLETGRFREFDAARNPAGTVLFQIAGELRPDEKRYFYVHAHPLEYADTQPFKYDLLDRSPVDSFLWGTRGTVTYGFEPQQEGQQHFLRIRSTVAQALTTVTVSTYELGRYVPLSSTTANPNPFTLQPGQDKSFFVPGNKAFKIESSHPVLVAGHGQNVQSAGREVAGYVPGRSGSFADDEFDVFGFRLDNGNTNSMTVRVYKGSPGTVTIQPAVGSAVTLTNANPWTTVGVPFGGVSTLRSTNGGKFLVSMQLSPPQASFQSAPFAPHPVPAISGGPSGVEFFTHLSHEEGWARICPEANSTARLVSYDSGGTLQLYPEGTVPNVPPALFVKREMCQDVLIPRTAPATHLWQLYATKEEKDPVPGAPVPMRMFVGTNERVPEPTLNLTRPFIGHFAGIGGVDHYVHGSVGLFGHYNDTRLTIFEERIRNGEVFVTNSTRGLQRDEFLPLKASDDSTRRWRIVATKPIGAVSLEPATYQQEDDNPTPGVDPTLTINVPYARYVPGRPVLPQTTIGKAEFKGPLVDLRSPEVPEARQLTRGTGPATPVSFRLDVHNLGRWASGEDLPDVVTVTCSTPVGWTVDGCNKDVSLGSGATERLTVVVTPSADDVNTTRTVQVEARSKLGGPVARFNLSVFVQIKYGVGMWFDVEDGTKKIDPPIGLDPDGTHTFQIVVKNTGSTQDTFRFRVDEAVEGWTQELLLDGEPVTTVRLDGNASTTLEFRVHAPNAETARQNLVSITAESLSSSLATDVVYPAARIRPKVDLVLTLETQTKIAAPNETATFNLTARNRGNDVFLVLFRQDSILPRGWDAELNITEIYLNPGDNATIGLAVTPPLGARAGDLASVKLAAEVDTGGAGGRVPGDEVSAVVVVQRVYDLSTPPILDARALPGETLRFVLPVSNGGNGQVTLEQLPGAVEAVLLEANGDERSVPGWRVDLEADSVTLGLNDTVDVPLTISVPEGTPPGIYDLTFTARLSREALQNLTIPVDVQVLARVDFVGPDSVALTPGRPVTLSYVARNSGNLDGSFSFAAQVPEGWNATFSPPRARLAPGDRVPVVVTLNTTSDARDGDYRVTLAAQAEGHAATPTDLPARLARPQLYLADVEGSGRLRAGELVLVTATVGNRGGITAENVSIALLVDGRVVDKILLSRIPVGSSALATLSWVSTQRGGDVKVVLDPDNEFSLADRAETAADVEFGSVLGLPGPAPLLVVALAFAAAFALRRRERA